MGHSLSGRSSQFKAVAHIVTDGHVRIKGIGLEHHGDIPVLGRQLVYDLPADADVSAGDSLQPCYHAQECGLAASRWTDQDHELSVLNRQVNIVKDGYGPVRLSDTLNIDRSHDATLQPLTAPAVRPWTRYR